jgi:hypothetical protein
MRSGALLILALAMTVTLSGCLAGGEFHAPEEASLTPTSSVPLTVPPSPPQETATPSPQPSLLRVQGEPAFLRISLPFNSSGKGHLVSLALDTAALPSRGGEASCPLSSWHPGDEERLASYYAGIFRDPAGDPLFVPLLAELRRYRRMEGLNDDEYLELLVHFVQGIPYDPHAPVCPRTPTGVILDGKGDCDEKSLLLLGLLEREGYAAAILLFPEKQHATAGIRIDIATQPSFRVFDLRGRKYVYIETTRPTFIGLYPDGFEDENPVIVPTGNGTITYRAINDVMHIVSTKRRMEEKMTWLSKTGAEMIDEIAALREKLSSGSGYSTREEYDADSSRYTTLVSQYNEYADQFVQIREVYLFITGHQDDRLGVAGRIANSKIEDLL